MKIKSLKIPTMVHKELKIFSSQNEESMIDFAGLAIMNELKAKGHKFIGNFVPKAKDKLKNDKEKSNH